MELVSEAVNDTDSGEKVIYNICSNCIWIAEIVLTLYLKLPSIFHIPTFYIIIKVNSRVKKKLNSVAVESAHFSLLLILLIRIHTYM